jgi:hypothetical protein
MLDIWGRENVHTGFWWENVREKRTLGRSGRTWEDNIEMGLQGIGWRHRLN